MPSLPRSGVRSWGYERTSPRPHTHNGIDLPADAGSPIYAADAGTVEHATPNDHQGHDPGFSGYGRVVVVRSDDDRRQLYAHALSTAVAEGERIERRQVIGLVGGTAYTAAEPMRVVGPHVHFEVSPRIYPQPSTEPRLDPVAWLSERGAGRVHPTTGEPIGDGDEDPDPAARRASGRGFGLISIGAGLLVALLLARSRR